MRSGKIMIIHLIAGQIKKRYENIKTSYYQEPDNCSRNKVKDISNYATKSEMKKATGVGTSEVVEKSD